MIRTAILSVFIQVVLWWGPVLSPTVRLVLAWIAAIAFAAGWPIAGTIAILACTALWLCELGD